MHRLSAIEIRNHFYQKEMSATDIATYFLKRIEKYDPKLNAFLHVLKERIEKKAIELDKKREEGKPLGKLAGIPIGIKDIIHIQGEVSSCGSRILQNYRAPFSSSVVRFLEEEDALLIGKTNLDEFAMGSSTEHSAFFPTKNPWDLSCTPGGSSGGSAAAVAARLCPISLGTDTGGSIRQPAALCGIVGYKPSYGRVSRYGLVAFASSLDQIGPLATNVIDCALMMEVLGQHCTNDSTSLKLPSESYLQSLPFSLKGFTFGIPWHFIEGVAHEIYSNFQKSVETLKSLGAKIIDIDLDILKYSIPTYYIIAPAEASTNLARFDGIRYGRRAKKAKTLDDIYDLSREEGFGSEVKKRIMLGTYVLSAGYKDAYYKKAQKVRKCITDAFESIFTKCDSVVLPSTPSCAFPLGSIQDPLEMYKQDLFTIPANLAGLPAISVPAGFNQSGMPLGLQFVGPQLHDVRTLSIAYAFETVTKYTSMIPPLFDQEKSI